MTNQSQGITKKYWQRQLPLLKRKKCFCLLLRNIPGGEKI